MGSIVVAQTVPLSGICYYYTDKNVYATQTIPRILRGMCYSILIFNL